MICLNLPYPPTGNTAWRKGPGGWYASAGYKAFIKEVALIVKSRGVGAWSADAMGRLSLTVYVYPPDKRKRDLDNVLKTTQDALTKSGVWSDDSLIDELHLFRKPPINRGGVQIFITSATLDEKVFTPG